MRKPNRHQQREARLLWQAIVRDGQPDPARIKAAVQALSQQPGRNTEAILYGLARRLEAHVRAHKVRVASADPLSAEQQKRLAANYPDAERIGGEIEFSTDPALLGGLRVQNGYQVVDRTVARELEILKSILLKQ